MIIITLKDSQKKFNFKNFEREQILKEMWIWCSKHCPEKKFKIRTDKQEQLILRMSDILELEFLKEAFNELEH